MFFTLLSLRKYITESHKILQRDVDERFSVNKQ